MNEDLQLKIAKYVAKAFSVASGKVIKTHQDALAKSKGDLHRRGLSLSGYANQQLIESSGSLIREMAIARAEVVMDAHELYGAPLEDSILDEIRTMLETKISGAANGLSTNPQITAFSKDIPQEQVRESIRQKLLVITSGTLNEISCQLEQRKVIPKMKRNDGGNVSGNVFHLHGHGARVNIQTTDQSSTAVNVVTQQELFTQLRDVINKQVVEDDKGEILQRLTALEQAEDSNVWDRFKEFIAVSGVLMKDFAPYIPALTEWAHKVAG